MVASGGATAIVLAAGRGRRLGADEPKAFLTIGGRTLMTMAASAAAASPAVAAIVVAVPPGTEARARAALAEIGLPVEVVIGGETRQESVAVALEAVAAGVATVICHDAARPFASPDLFGTVADALVDEDGAVPVIPVTDTLKRVVDDVIVGTEAREGLARAQTPQAFRTDALREAHARAHDAGVFFTDDAAAMEWAGYRVVAVPGDPTNFKITTLLDLTLAEARMGAV
jgi:2-C-methyl-D-erythritol 4-phosphate cytidylyltransferase